jgi:hypothetical protein
MPAQTPLWQLLSLPGPPQNQDACFVEGDGGKIEFDEKVFVAWLELDEREKSRGLRLPAKRRRVNTVRPSYSASSFFKLYVLDELGIMVHNQALFRTRFRVPVACYRDLLALVKLAQDTHFRGFGKSDASGRPGAPLELLLLGTLRYLGRHCQFDDLKEATYVDKETHRRFFFKFCLWGREFLYPLHVTAPSCKEDIVKCEELYRAAGFPGCIGSFDVTHVPLNNLSVAKTNSYKNGKHIYPTIAYQTTVSHSGLVLSVCPGKPGTWNDKTIIKYDEFIQSLSTNDLFTTYEWQRRVAGPSEWVTETGVYCICDGGYLQKPTMMSAFHMNSDEEDIHWSMLGSLRKDVETFFGRLKKRFTIFHDGVRVHDVEKMDDIFFTCVALHNWLHCVDGLGEQWETTRAQEVRLCFASANPSVNVGRRTRTCLE